MWFLILYMEQYECLDFFGFTYGESSYSAEEGFTFQILRYHFFFLISDTPKPQSPTAIL